MEPFAIICIATVIIALLFGGNNSYCHTTQQMIKDIDKEREQNRRFLMIVCAVMVLCFGCKGSALNPNQWTGFVYPDQTNMRDYIEIGNFISLEECRDKSLDRLIDNYQGTYECGLNCEFNPQMQINVCEVIYSSRR